MTRFHLHCVGSLRSLHGLGEAIPGFDGQCSLVALAGSRLRAAEVYGAAQARLETA